MFNLKCSETVISYGQNSSQKVKEVAKFMNSRASKSDCIFGGHYTLTDDQVSHLLKTAVHYSFLMFYQLTSDVIMGMSFTG